MSRKSNINENMEGGHCPRKKVFMVTLMTVMVMMMMMTMPTVWTTSLWEKSCPRDCSCTVEPWPYIQLDAKVVRCENQSLELVPRNLTTETEVLLLGHNNLGAASDIYLHDFRYMQSMRFLDLSYNRIRVIHAHGIGFPQVKYLNLSHNSIHNLQAEVLSDFTHLEYLNIDYNNIGTLTKAVFSLPHLRYLNLCHNKIFTLKPDFHFNIPNLNTLIMSHNFLTRFSDSVFFRTPILDKLDLSYNRLSKVEDLAFDGLRSLSELNLEGNALRSVPTTSLRAIASIGHLLLNHNPIRQLDSTSFRALNVTHISVCNLDELGVVYERTFSDMPHLTTIEMSSNKALTSIASNTFRSLPRLQTVDLRNNNLYVIEEGIRNQMELLKVEKHLIDTLETGKYVNRDATTDSPVDTEEEEEVDVSGSDESMMSNSLTMQLTGNPLICDCNVKWIQDILLRQYSHNVTVLDGNNVKCLDHTQNVAVSLMDLDELPSQCAPFILPLFHPVVKETVASDVSFLCRGVGIPSPIVRWVLPDGRVLSNDLCEGRVCVRDNTLLIKTVHVQDSGVYECQANNALGQFKRSLHLEVDNVNILLFPLSVTSNFVTLAWNASGLPPAKFLLQYGPSDVGFHLEVTDSSMPDGGLKVIEMATKTHSYTVGGLSPGETYTFWLCIKRSEYSIKVSSLEVTTREENFLIMFGIRRNYMSIIMIGGIAGIIFLGCAFMCCLKLCRWARKEHSEMLATSESGSSRCFVKSDSCNSDVAFMTYINVSDDYILVDHEDESPQ